MLARPVLVLALFAAGASAQTDALYYTDTGTHTLHLVQFGGDAAFPAGPGSTDEMGIAVAGGDVRTVGSRNDPTRQYDLACTYTGPSFARPAIAGDLYDGTTDGVRNYSVCSDGWVYSFDRNWQSPVQLFQPLVPSWGITYDDVNKSLWLSHGNGGVDEYAMSGGSPLSSFTLLPGTFPENALAWEPSTDTIWVIENYGGTVAQQYSKFGAPMASVPLAGGIHPLGGAEFDLGAVPAPGGSLLLGLAVLGAVRRRRPRPEPRAHL